MPLSKKIATFTGAELANRGPVWHALSELFTGRVLSAMTTNGWHGC